MSMIDMFYVTVLILFFGIIAIVGMYVADAVFPQLTEFFGVGDATTVATTAKNAYNTMDFIFLFIYFGLMISPIIFAVFVQNHPIFLVINIIIFLVYFLIVPSLSNIMHEFWSVEEFAPYSAGGSGSFTFVIITRIFQYMPIISVVLSIILMVAQFAKSRSGGGLD